PPCNDPGADTTPCSFLGTRTAGDIVVSMDFLNGGGFGTLSIREWSGTSYVQVASLMGEGCNGADTICGFNNGGLIDGGPWPNYERHGMEITMLPRNAFTEFGVDVTAVAGVPPCGDYAPVRRRAPHREAHRVRVHELRDGKPHGGHRFRRDRVYRAPAELWRGHGVRLRDRRRDRHGRGERNLRLLGR